MGAISVKLLPSQLFTLLTPVALSSGGGDAVWLVSEMWPGCPWTLSSQDAPACSGIHPYACPGLRVPSLMGVAPPRGGSGAGSEGERGEPGGAPGSRPGGGTRPARTNQRAGTGGSERHATKAPNGPSAAEGRFHLPALLTANHSRAPSARPALGGKEPTGGATPSAAQPISGRAFK